VTPLNTECPFGVLRAWSPTLQSRGAAWLISATTTEPAITVRARGWSIQGFEIDANTSSGCVYLDGTTGSANPKFFELANCLMVGGAHGSDFGILTDVAAPLTVLRDSTFYQFGGKAMDATDFPLKWSIERVWFEDNANHIAPSSSKGLQASRILDCTFVQLGALYSAALKIDNRGGSTLVVGPGNVLGGSYNNAGGYYAGAGDIWAGNLLPSGLTVANPAA